MICWSSVSDNNILLAVLKELQRFIRFLSAERNCANISYFDIPLCNILIVCLPIILVLKMEII